MSRGTLRVTRKGVHESIVTIGGALIGLAVAAFVSSMIRFPVTPAQPVGFAKLHGFNPRGPVVTYLLLFLGSLGGAVLSRQVFKKWGSTLRAPLMGFLSISTPLKLAIGITVGLAAMTVFQGIPVTWSHMIAWASWIALGAVLPLARDSTSERRIGLSVAAAHAVTLWTLLAAPAWKLGVAPPASVALLLAISTLEGYWLGSRNLERGAPNLALAALAFPLAFWSGRTETACIVGGAAAALFPVAGSLFSTVWARLHSSLRILAVTIFLPGSFVALGAAACLRTAPIASFFEDGHALLPASEYLRGELPYKDILPGHGLVSDGVLQAIELRVFGEDYRGLGRGNKLVGALFWPSIYALGLAATGSPTVGFWGLCLSFVFFPQYMFFRVMASLACLAMTMQAARAGRPGAWIAAGAALPVAMLCGLEFWAYTVVAAVAAIWVSRGNRRAHVRGFLLGIAGTTAAMCIIFASRGFLGNFLHDTFVFLPKLFPIYSLGPPSPPNGIVGRLHSIDAFASLLDATALYYWFLPAALLVAVSLLAGAPVVGARGRALLPLLVWFCAAWLSVLERHHLGYPFFVVPVSLLLLARWVKGYAPWRTSRGWAAVVILGIAIVASRPDNILDAAAFSLEKPRPPGNTQVVSSPTRAKGGLFETEDAKAIAATERFLKAGFLAPDETWLDFSNASILYFLFNRDCPIRYYEVAFYETPEAQQEVIAAIQRNRRVRAVLMRTGHASDWVDGIDNQTRAPLVFEYILKEFQPAFAQDGVEFWLRRSPSP